MQERTPEGLPRVSLPQTRSPILAACYQDAAIRAEGDCPNVRLVHQRIANRLERVCLAEPGRISRSGRHGLAVGAESNGINPTRRPQFAALLTRFGFPQP